MKLYKSFKEISLKNKKIEFLFLEKLDFWAHTHAEKPNETLQKHISEVKNYVLRLIEINGLESIIDNLISQISFNNHFIGDFLKAMLLNTFVFHDFGKINPNFQVERMKNTINNFIADNSIKIGYEHSFLSAYIFLNYYFDFIHNSQEKPENKSLLWAYSFLFSIPIIKHHSGYLAKDYDFENEKIKSIHQFVKILGKDIPFEFSNAFFENEIKLWQFFDEYKKDKDFDYFPLFALLKLSYSLLTASDYLATSEYMSDLKLETETDFGLISEEMKAKLIQNFDNNRNKKFNGDLIRNHKLYFASNEANYRLKDPGNLNYLRQKLAAEVLTNIEKFKTEKVFYIEAPTGGGKTNMSMIAVRKLLELQPEINKVFYVFPFTTLITQTAKAIKETFGLKDTDIAQIHSKSGFQEKEYENEIDAKYGKEKRNQIDNLFVNYPFALMTHIKFFDILKSNKKDTNYLLHRLANSVVIIDELQAYSTSEWDKIKYFIAQYAELFNIRFVIMSATLPKIDEIKLSDYKPKKFIPLIDNAKRYLQNPNFAERVEIKTDLLHEKIELKKLTNLVFDKSENYAETRTDEYKGSIYTIIEFIFKKSAVEFYEESIKKEKFFDEIFVLSGTILEPRRKYIIEFLKDPANRKKKILLITTQVVEAGVDIDMDLGFKNQSLIDSDEQLAGRINRNVKKKNCELWLFKYDKPKSIYGKDLRYEVTEEFKPDFVKEILTKKEFEKLYKNVFANIIKTNKAAHIKGFNDYRDNFRHFDFKGIHQDFKLIDSENASIFVPLDICILCYKTVDKNGKEQIENNFSKNEINFIRKNNCITFENKVSGEDIWDLYISLIENKKMDFSKKNLEMKILNGIMSKFVFSVFMKKIDDLFEFIENPATFENDKFQQYFKLRKDKIKEIYSEESGINEKYLEEITNKSYKFI